MTEELPLSGRIMNAMLVRSGATQSIQRRMDIMYAIRAVERRAAHRKYVEEQRRLGVKITVNRET